MAYLINFLNILRQSISIYPLQSILFSIIIILAIIIRKVFKYKNTSTNYKIENTFINIMNILCYATIFLLAIIYLRYIRIGNSIELYPIYEKWQRFFLEIPVTVSVIFIQLVVLLLCILIKIREYFGRELWKKHLYVYHISFNNTMKNLLSRNINPLQISLDKEYSLYNTIVNKLKDTWAWGNVLSNIQWKYFLQPYCKRYHLERIPTWAHYCSIIPLRYIHILILFVILYYDLFYNNYTLHYIFYYLPLYFFYSLWKTISNTFSQTDSTLDFIIFERFYEEENVIYANTTDEEEFIIQEYIKRGFKSYIKDLSPIDNQKEWEFMANFPTIFKTKRRFVRNLNTGMFENKNTGESFDSNDINIEKIYK